MLEFKLFHPSDQLLILRKFVLDILSVWNSFLWDPVQNGFLILENTGTKSLLVTFDAYKNSSEHGGVNQMEITSNKRFENLNNSNKCKENLEFFNALNTEMNNDIIIRDLVID